MCLAGDFRMPGLSTEEKLPGRIGHRVRAVS